MKISGYFILDLLYVNFTVQDFSRRPRRTGVENSVEAVEALQSGVLTFFGTSVGTSFSQDCLRTVRQKNYLSTAGGR